MTEIVKRPATEDGTLVQDDTQLARARALSCERPESPGAVPGYEIRGCLGQGSFGSVWLARENRTGKQVAIKFYTHRRGLDWSLLSREVEKLAVLYTSRDVVRLLDVGWDHSPPYFVMEYLEQGSLAGQLVDGPIRAADAVRIAKAVLRGLVHAHGSGILHCDLKPANILLDGNREPRLADFGQSRLSTEQSPALGTLFYMAPEQADLTAVPDARWDVYALGALLYHMLTGSPPYRTPAHEARIEGAKSLEERLRAYRELIASSPLPKAHHAAYGVDKRLAEIVDRCLQPDPQLRYPNAQVVLDQLDQRDQVRSKRPLMILGFVGPALFLLATLWIARKAAPEPVRAAERSLIDRALASDVVAVHILAIGLEQELMQRQRELEELAHHAELRALLQAAEGKSAEELRQLVEQRHPDDKANRAFRDINQFKLESDASLRAADRTPDESWFITDARGRQVYRQPPTGTIGRPFHHRDYFHGRGIELQPDTDPASVAPRIEPGISLPFRSQATGQFMVAIAVPVWDEPHDRVIGILARTIHLTELLKQWEEGIQASETPADVAEKVRFIALAETRSEVVELLDHPWMEALSTPRFEELEVDVHISPLRLDAAQSGIVRSNSRTDDYHDPVAVLDPKFDGAWLAAFAPVGDTGWTAIVQERRSSVLRPVENLHQIFERNGLWGLGVFSLILGILWYLIHRASTQ